MALTRYGDLQFRYNSYENTEYKPHLPIVGNEIPSVLHTRFESLDELAVSGTGAAMALNYGFAYNAVACTKVTVASAGNATVTYTPTETLNMQLISQSDKDFARLSITGKYGNAEDMLFGALNVLVDTSQSWHIITKFYSGTKTATLKDIKSISASAGIFWRKENFAFNDTDFTYADSFTSAEWETIDKVDIVFYMDTAGAGNYFYLGGLWSALPCHSTPETQASRTAAYYPDVSVATSVYVSKIFGNNANSGVTRKLPVKDITTAFTKITATRINIVILDSETYKPILADYSDIGIKPTLNVTGGAVKIIADYLETPKISCEAGISDKTKAGARKARVSSYITYQKAVGTIRTVGVGGTYATIATALAGASNGDCIQIIDDSTYTENLTISKNITIEALPGKIPTLRGTITNDSSTLYVDGLIIKGASGTSEVGVNTAGTSLFKNCTISSWGGASGASKGFYIQGGTTIIEQCLFINNGEYFIAIDKQLKVAATIQIIENLAYMGATKQNAFYHFGLSTASNSLSNMFTNTVLGSSDASSSLLFCGQVNDASNTGTNPFYCYLNDSNMPSVLNYTNVTGTTGYYISAFIRYNYFHDCLVNYSGGAAGSSFGGGVDSIDAFLLLYFQNALLAAVMYTKVSNNYFYNITYSVAGLGRAAVSDALIPTTTRTTEIKNNIFDTCTRGLHVYDGPVANNLSYDQNIFLSCGAAFQMDKFNGGVLATYTVQEVIANCTTGITGTLRLANGILYSAPNGVTGYEVVDTTVYTTDPKINKLVRGSLVPEFDGSYNVYFGSDATYLQSKIFISPTVTAGETLTFMFMDIEGANGFTGIRPTTCPVLLKYCNVHDFMYAVKNTVNVDVQNCLMEYNGITVRPELTTTAACNFKYNIVKNNYIGIELKSYLYCEHNTIIENSYGVMELLTGYLSADEYARLFSTMKDNIIFNNAVYDYYSRLFSDYCIIGSRFYDVLPDTDIRQIDTIGAHDVTSNPLLNDQYFPGLKVLGEVEDSPAYMADSSGTGNIGARYINRIKAVFTYDSYTVASNPQDYTYRVTPVNLESSVDVSGEYQSTQDAESVQIAFNWGEPGRISKILSAQKTRMEYIYQTYWIVGISLDSGASWNYYKVIKDVNPITNQIGFYYHELPWGEWSMEFHKMPADFDITDYAINTMEA